MRDAAIKLDGTRSSFVASEQSGGVQFDRGTRTPWIAASYSHLHVGTLCGSFPTVHLGWVPEGSSVPNKELNCYPKKTR